MNKGLRFTHTIGACCAAYITQSIVINFVPLLFVMFNNNYSVSLAQISALITLTFLLQLAVDFSSAPIVRRFGYRKCVIAAHFLAAAGLIMLGILPDILPNPYVGILTACIFYSCGSGLIEVIVSPLTEACPGEHKASQMAFLHSFYCWGTVLVVFASTMFFVLFGIDNWRMASISWALLPIVNAFFFMRVPIPDMEETEERRVTELLRTPIMWVIIILMICSGAAELAMSQWASAFAESALGVSKTLGDLAGPCMFAVLMGTGRIVYSKLVKKVDLMKYMMICAVLCIISYLLAVFSSRPLFALIGCAMTGFAVGVFWPGTFSFATADIPTGGAAMFGLLAFAGDAGCTIGPAVVGYVSGIFGDNLKAGLLAAIIFPAILLFISMILTVKKEKRKQI